MKLVIVALLLSVSSTVFAVGLGDKISDIRTQYGSKVSIDDTYYVFSKPPRAARIDIDVKKFFGIMPTSAEFVRGIKPLLPTDAKVISAVTKSTPPLKKEIYTFKSAAIAKLPNIKDAALDSPSGTFTLYIVYDGEKAASCALNMGLPGDVDLAGTKKMTRNPFK